MKRVSCLYPIFPRLSKAIALGVLVGFVGCVERKMIIRSDPPDADVYVDGTPMGKTPVEIPFKWYGTREVTLYKKGHEMVVEKARLKLPWYQLPGLDFLTDVLLPTTIHDVHSFEYTLPPVQQDADKDEVRTRALKMKELMEQKP